MVFSSLLPSSMKRSATSMFALETLKERIVVNYSSEQLLDYITLIVKKENKQPHFCFFLGCLTNGLIHVCYQIYLHQLNKKGNLPFTKSLSSSWWNILNTKLKNYLKILTKVTFQTQQTGTASNDLSDFLTEYGETIIK